MQRLILLILVLTAVTSQAAPDPTSSGIAKLWSASVQAETDKNYDEAINQTVAFQQQGGDRFLATLRSGWLYYLKEDYAKARKPWSPNFRIFF